MVEGAARGDAEVIAALALHVALAGADNPAKRLAVGSEWRCASPFADGAELEFKIMRSDRGGTGTMMVVTRASTGITLPVTGYGMGRGEKYDLFDPREDRRDPFYLYMEYGQGFYNWGVGLLAKWKARDPRVELNLTLFNYEHREDPVKRDEKFFSFWCQKTSV